MDGTLVNSEIGIRSALVEATYKISQQHVAAAELVAIGPSIDEVSQKIFQDCSEKIKYDFIELFKKIYDSVGYLQTEPYPNATLVLEELYDLGHIISIATNKRAEATKKLISYFQWNRYFSEVNCLDEFHKKKLGKTEMIKEYLKSINVRSHDDVMYIGDTFADFKVASDNEIKFIFASYGYEKNFPSKYLQNLTIINNLKDFLKIIKK